MIEVTLKSYLGLYAMTGMLVGLLLGGLAGYALGRMRQVNPMINREDIERIIAEKEYWQKDRAETWDAFTRHMEMGELREYKQACIDEDIVIECLKIVLRQMS